MAIELTPQIEALLHKKAQDKYGSVEAVLEAALESLQRDEAQHQLLDMLDEGLRDLEQGHYTELSANEVGSLFSDVRQRFLNR